MVIHWVEIYKFLKNNIIKVILSSIIIALIVAFINNNPFIKSDSEIVENEKNIGSTNDIVEVPPAVFYMFIENEDETSFGNNLLLEQFVLTQKVLKDASMGRKIDLVRQIEETSNLIKVNYNDSGESKIIGVGKNDSTQLMEFYVNVGEKKENLAIANFFYDFILNDGIPFLSNKNIYIFKEPAILEVDIKYDAFSQEVSVKENSSLFRDTVLGITVGFLITTVLLLSGTFLTKKLVYSFSYFVENEDVFILIDKKTNNIKEVKNLLEQPSLANNIVILEEPIDNDEDSLFTEYFKNHNSLIHTVSNFSEITEPQNLQKVFYFIEEGITARDWYHNQRRLDRYYNIPKIIVQFNKIK